MIKQIGFQQGEILCGTKTKHPIIFLGDLHGEEFLGCIITHAGPSRYPGNIELNKEHFQEFDDQGNKFSIQWDKTFFVGAKLKKKSDWGPFICRGKLTKEGLEIVQKFLEKKKPQAWESFIEQRKSYYK